MKRLFAVLLVVLLESPMTFALDLANLEAMKKRAEQGDWISQNQLGSLYAVGDEIVPRNHVESVKWHRMAAEQGAPMSQCQMGFAYLNGRGVHQDNREAAKWFLLAADQGDLASMDLIARMYYEGKGVPQDYAEAYFWFNNYEALCSGFPENRDLAASMLTPSKRQEVQARCTKWIEHYNKLEAALERQRQEHLESDAHYPEPIKYVRPQIK